MHSPDTDDHADVRLGDRGQFGDLPAAAHPQSRTSTSVSAGARRGSGSPISVLRLSGLRRWQSRRGTRPTMSLVEVLPVEPVIAITCAPSARRQARASPCRPRSGSGWASRTPGPAPAPRARARRARPRPRPAAPPCDAPPSARVAAQTDEQVSGADLARVDRRPATVPRGAAARRAEQPRAGGRATRAESQFLMRRTAPPAGARAEQPPQRLARHGDVVEGQLLAAGELLALLVALAGDHEHVAGAGSRRPFDRLAAVDDLAHVLGPGPRRPPGDRPGPRR